MDVTSCDALRRSLSVLISRRTALRHASALVVGAELTSVADDVDAQRASPIASSEDPDQTAVVNDVHTQLNATHVYHLVRPD